MKKVFVLSALLYFTQVNAQWQQADCPFASKDRIECMATNGSTILLGDIWEYLCRMTMAIPGVLKT